MQLTKRKIRWGIVGAGRIARIFAEGLKYVDDADLWAVGARRQEAADEFATVNSVRRAYGSIAELLADAEIDVVYVATPHHTHRDHCVSALNAGKHILCEKPFALNADQAEEVVSIAREKKLFCMEAMWMRFIPAMQLALSKTRAGEIGDARFLRADFGIAFPFDPEARQFDLSLAGGALLDLGVYPVNLALQLFGPPTSIRTSVESGKTGVDESSFVLLEHSFGRLSAIRSSIISDIQPDAMITGTRGSMHIHAPLYRPHKLTVHQFARPGSTEVAKSQRGRLSSLLKTSNLVWKIALHAERYVSPVRAALQTEVIPFYGNGYNYQAAEVGNCIRSGALESATMPLGETVVIMKVLDDIRAQWGLRFPGE